MSHVDTTTSADELLDKVRECLSDNGGKDIQGAAQLVRNALGVDSKTLDAFMNQLRYRSDYF